jgi:hypothetical protein
MSQPAREFVVKIIELSLWSSDLLIGHFLLFMMTPFILIPYIDRLHAALLCESPFSMCVNEVLLNPCSSLVATLEANSCSSVYFQAEAAASLDSKRSSLSVMIISDEFPRL